MLKSLSLPQGERSGAAPRSPSSSPVKPEDDENGGVYAILAFHRTRAMIRFALIALLFATQTAAADGMAFFIDNRHPGDVAVELYGRQTTWPGDDQVYLIEKGMKKSVPITCEAGETICWAAWVNGDARTYWGVGPDNIRPCVDCCVTCANKTTATVEIGE